MTSCGGVVWRPPKWAKSHHTLLPFAVQGAWGHSMLPPMTAMQHAAGTCHTDAAPGHKLPGRNCIAIPALFTPPQRHNFFTPPPPGPSRGSVPVKRNSKTLFLPRKWGGCNCIGDPVCPYSMHPAHSNYHATQCCTRREDNLSPSVPTLSFMQINAFFQKMCPERPFA